MATKKTVKTEKAEAATTAAAVTKIAAQVLVRPIVTEKAATAQSTNKYTFVVGVSAKKNQVKAAIKEMYGIMPTKVNVINVQGEVVYGGRGRKSDFKKAIVTLPKGKSITIHEGV